MVSIFHRRALVVAAVFVVTTIGMTVWYVQNPSSRSEQKSHGPERIPAPAKTTVREGSGGDGRSAHSANATPAPRHAGALPEQPALEPLPAAPLENPEDRSPLADELNIPRSTAVRDVEIVYSLFAAYRERFGGIPTGEDNATIVNALTGNNPKRIAFIERSHPAINARGEMVDRWGVPLFFHIESREHWEIRSAGPDGEMYTNDDVRKRTPSSGSRGREMLGE